MRLVRWFLNVLLVGLCVAILKPWGQQDPINRNALTHNDQTSKLFIEITDPIDNLPQLARLALTHYFESGQVPVMPSSRISPWSESSGLFVTLTHQGRARGCWGSLVPVAPDLATATIQAAIGAATQDWRYPPVQASELDILSIQVSIIQQVFPIQSLAHIDPTQSGLFIRSGPQGAVLLPGEALTAQWQLATARKLAGIPENAEVELFQVEAEIFHDF